LNQAPEKYGLGVLNLQESSAIVPIPVLEEKTEEEPTALSAASEATPHPSLPTISITKPPPPLPIGVPTVNDVLPLPSPPDSRRSSSDDIEACRGLGYRESMDESTLPRTTPHLPSIVKKTEPPKMQLSSPTVVDDLLADSAPLEDVPSMSPAKIETETNARECLPESDPPQSVVDGPIDTTIRIAGEGRLSGADDALPLTAGVEDAPNPVEPQSRQGKTHEKNDSSSSLTRKSTSTTHENGNGESTSTNSIPESR